MFKESIYLFYLCICSIMARNRTCRGVLLGVEQRSWTDGNYSYYLGSLFITLRSMFFIYINLIILVGQGTTKPT